MRSSTYTFDNGLHREVKVVSAGGNAVSFQITDKHTPKTHVAALVRGKQLDGLIAFLVGLTGWTPPEPPKLEVGDIVLDERGDRAVITYVGVDDDTLIDILLIEGDRKGASVTVDEGELTREEEA